MPSDKSRLEQDLDSAISARDMLLGERNSALADISTLRTELERAEADATRHHISARTLSHAVNNALTFYLREGSDPQMLTEAFKVLVQYKTHGEC